MAALKKEAGHDGGVKEGDFVVLVPESGGGTPCIVKVTKQPYLDFVEELRGNNCCRNHSLIPLFLLVFFDY